MRTIICNTVNNSYPILVGCNLLQDPSILTKFIAKRRTIIITDSNVAPRYLQRVLTLICNVETIILPAGEINKTWQTVEQILQQLIANNHDRHSMLIALGGGVVGDIVGFTASCYMRGIPWLLLPTSLLAQVDAAVGGKTGINYAGQKNIIGSFYQPSAVITDIAVLQTLPQREYIAGFAEVIKYSVIADADFFAWLETNCQPLLQRDLAALNYAVQRCCELKAAIVATDEREQTGRRVILNFGHTLAHALEAATNFQDFLHGEAVAIGMVFATKLSLARGYVSNLVCRRLIKLLTKFGLPTNIIKKPGLYAKILLHMQHDKKSNAGKINFNLLNDIGSIRLETVELTSIKECYFGKSKHIRVSG